MNKFNIKNWFFLDMSMPNFVKYSENSIKNFSTRYSPDNLAVRFSDKEPIEYALSFSKKVKWVWVDYFCEFPLSRENYALLKKENFKICLVSPEIQENKFIEPKDLASLCSELLIDAVCTKFPDLWQ